MVTVRNRDVEARSFPIPKADGPISTDRAELYRGEHVEPSFQRLLTDRGLSQAEARSLMAICAHDLFRREGRRFLLVLSADDYNTLCPLRITPAPTSIHRVGIIVTELPQN